MGFLDIVFTFREGLLVSVEVGVFGPGIKMSKQELLVKNKTVKITVEFDGIIQTWEYDKAEIDERHIMAPSGDLTNQYTLSINARKEVY